MRDRAIDTPTAAAVERLLAGLVERDLASAVHALIGTRREVVLGRGAGAVDEGLGVPTERSLFDLASLTKPWVATLALVLDRSGELPLGLEIGEVFAAARRPLADRSLEELLRHRSGLEAWQPLYRRVADPQRVAVYLLDRASHRARCGTYSDLGYILWGLAAERQTGEALGRLLLSRVARPLGVAREVAVTPGPRRGVVACRLDNLREVELAAERGVRVAVGKVPEIGEPQDGNARFLGGLGGHAGLFASTRALWALGREWLDPGHLLDPRAITGALGGTGNYRLGWRRRRLRGSGGPHLSAAAIGHVGFTGGSLWLDPRADRIAVLLAHRATVGDDLSAARRRFHRLVTEPTVA